MELFFGGTEFRTPCKLAFFKKFPLWSPLQFHNQSLRFHQRLPKKVGQFSHSLSKRYAMRNGVGHFFLHIFFISFNSIDISDIMFASMRPSSCTFFVKKTIGDREEESYRGPQRQCLFTFVWPEVKQPTRWHFLFLTCLTLLLFCIP